MESWQKRESILDAATSYALNKISDYFNYSLLQGVLGGGADNFVLISRFLGWNFCELPGEYRDRVVSIEL